MAEKRIVSDENVCYVDHGIGEVVLFIHGYLERAAIWKGIFQYDLNFRSVAIDLPGHGQSRALEEDFTFDTIAKWLNQFLIKQNIEKVHLVGHSMGGYVAMAFAAMFNSKVKSLVLLHSTPLTDPPQRKKLREREMHFLTLGKKQLMLMQFTDKLFAPDTEHLFCHYKEELNESANQITSEQMLAYTNAMKSRIEQCEFIKNAPFATCLVVGKYDQLLTTERVNEVRVLLPDIEIITFENSGHLAFVEQERDFIHLLTKKIKEES